MVREDKRAAAFWILRAAEQGFAPAEFQAGIWYRDGKNGSQDRARAYFWLDWAASQGFTRAGKDRKVLARRMTPRELTEAKRLLAIRKAFETGVVPPVETSP